MSEQDRERWNARYAAGAYGSRRHTSALLADWLEQLPRGRALDLACGSGRNAVYLASQGYQVDAIDVSSVALEIGEQRAAAAGVSVNWLEQDLDAGPEVAGQYALITLFRYADLALVERLAALLQPGGVLMVEAHLGGKLFTADVGGPGSERFRLPPGALAQAARGLEVLHSSESHVGDPDGRLMALARFVGRRSGATQQPDPADQ